MNYEQLVAITCGTTMFHAGIFVYFNITAARGHRRLVFELVVDSLWDICVHFNLFSNYYTSDYT